MIRQYFLVFLVCCLYVNASAWGEKTRWGPRLNGLRCRIEGRNHDVHVGDVLAFCLRLDYKEHGLQSKYQALNRYLDDNNISLRFTSTSDGRSYIRGTVDQWYGMPVASQEADVVPLHGEVQKPQSFGVRLLSEKGEQVPPGDYRVVAVYENDGAAAGGPVSAEQSATLWEGFIESQPIEIEVQRAVKREVLAKTNSKITITHGLKGEAGTTSLMIRLQKAASTGLGARKTRLQ